MTERQAPPEVPTLKERRAMDQEPTCRFIRAYLLR